MPLFCKIAIKVQSVLATEARELVPVKVVLVVYAVTVKVAVPVEATAFKVVSKLVLVCAIQFVIAVICWAGCRPVSWGAPGSTRRFIIF